MDARQDVPSGKQANAQRTAPGLFAASALAQPVAARTMLLIATIVLVAFALYMVRPSQPEATTTRSITSDSGAEAANHHHAGSIEAGTQEATGEAGGHSSTTNRVIVNGREIPVPKDGNLHQTIRDGDTTTTVNISSSGDSSTTSSSSNISVHSSSQSESEGDEE
jgi:hypothetical protein